MRFGVLTGTAIGAVALVGAGYALDGKRSSKNVSKPVVQLAQNSPSRPVAAQGSSPARPDFDRDRAQRLQEALTGLVNGPVLGRLRVGMRVMDVASGRVLFGQR